MNVVLPNTHYLPSPLALGPKPRRISMCLGAIGPQRRVDVQFYMETLRNRAAESFQPIDRSETETPPTPPLTPPAEKTTSTSGPPPHQCNCSSHHGSSSSHGSHEHTPQDSVQGSPLTAAPCLPDSLQESSNPAPATEPNNERLEEWNNRILAHLLKGKPEDAIALLESMMDSTNTEVIPNPACSTYACLVSGFCQSGDVMSALTWFDRMVDRRSCCPNRQAYSSMFEGLAARGSEAAIKHLNRLFTLLRTASVHPVLYRDKVLVLSANEALIRSRSSFCEAKEQIDFVVEAFRELPLATAELAQLIKLLVDAERSEDACAILHHSLEDQISADSDADLVDLFIICSSILESAHLPLSTLLSLSKLAAKIGAPPPLDSLVQAYFNARSGQEFEDLTCCQWPVLVSAFADAQLRGDLDAFSSLEDGTPFVSTLISDIRAISPDRLAKVDMKLVDEVLIPAQTRLCTSATPPLVHPPPVQPAFAPHFPASHPDLCISIDARFSRTLDDLLHHTARNIGRRVDPGPITAFSLFISSARSGKFPVIETIGRLINALGRMREISKVQEVYAHSQVVLSSLCEDKARQAQGWFHVEDQMIEAFSHAGDVESASVHRTRIIALGGAPSADAYGALISCIKDTTDDASVAVELFEESQRLGVRANTFLYNTLISKLSRARKAKYVLKLFRRMSDEGLRPSSVTYGAVICACCRVGDEQSAAQLFEQMVAMPNFKPKATPYNTMMQAYLTKTAPERDRVLYYYGELLKAKVRPTAHTYKLLIDCYGTIEPVDNRAMQKTFDQLVSDPTVTVQGTHWAALINAWGCVSKNLDKAISVFESIAKHPSTARSRSPLPDAIVFETLINVLVTLRRMDLVPGIVDQIHKTIHPTAYICNSLIKGYAASGDIEEARRTFESLLDPPMGVAASYNHTAHERDQPYSVPIDSPVYREPSTWEAMLRAELGAGNRDRAVLLLERMKTRMFPDALTSRIRRILREDESNTASLEESTIA